MSQRPPSSPRPAGMRVIHVVIPCVALLVVPAVVLWAVPGPRPPGRATASRFAPSQEKHLIESARLPVPRASSRGPEEPALEAARPVEGQVLDPDGHPIAAANVMCNDRNDRDLHATTDAAGHFTLDAAAGAGCEAVARYAGFAPSHPQRLSSGGRNTLSLRRGSGIEGVVVDDRGNPIEQFAVGIESYVGDDPSGNLPSSREFRDREGRFRFEGLAPGSYVFTASNSERPPARSDSVRVDDDAPPARVRIVLTKGGVLRGHVVDADTHAPIARAIVALDGVTVTGVASVPPVPTDERGEFTLSGTPRNLFSIRVAHSRYRTAIVSGLNGDGAALGGKEIRLHALVDGGAREELVGVGAILDRSPKGVVVREVLEGGAAARADLRSGDILRRVDGRDVTGWPVVACMQAIRGQEGSRVTLLVERNGTLVETTVVRAVVLR